MTGWGLNLLFLFLFGLLLDAFFVNDILVIIWVFVIRKGVVASLLSMIIVFVFTFVMNKIWTFREQGREFQPNTLFQFFQFTLIGLTGFALFTGFMLWLHGSLNWNEYLASSIAFFVGLVNNFIWNDLWTFNPKLIEKRKLKRENKELRKNKQTLSEEE